MQSGFRLFWSMLFLSLIRSSFIVSSCSSIRIKLRVMFKTLCCAAKNRTNFAFISIIGCDTERTKCQVRHQQLLNVKLRDKGQMPSITGCLILGHLIDDLMTCLQYLISVAMARSGARRYAKHNSIRSTGTRLLTSLCGYAY
jgi:hypothetical protein